MSWIDAVAESLLHPRTGGWLLLCRTGFGAACIVKCLTEAKRGYLSSYQPTTYLYFRLRVMHLRIRQHLPGRAVFLVCHALRAVCSVTLFVGLLPRLSAAVLFVVLVAETRVYFNFHVCYFALFAGALVFAPDLPTLPAAITTGGLLAFGPPMVDPSCYWLIVITTSALYVCGAYRKLNSVFLSGTVVWATLTYVVAQQPLRHHFDGIYPDALRGWLQRTPPGSPLWRSAMAAVVVLEAALPALLLVPATSGPAAIAGIGMHLTFTLLFPATLTPFSIATIASYPAFFALAW